MIWRLRERSAFDRLSSEGTRRRTESLWCTFLSDPAAVPPRVAFAIGRRIAPAATRNRLRRRLRALLAEHARDSRLPAGWYLFGATAATVELTFDELRADLDALLAKVRAA